MNINQETKHLKGNIKQVWYHFTEYIKKTLKKHRTEDTEDVAD